MSKYNNVNPNHYKVKGRERQGEDIVHDVQKQKASKLAKRGAELPETRQFAKDQPPPGGEDDERGGSS